MSSPQFADSTHAIVGNGLYELCRFYDDLSELLPNVVSLLADVAAEVHGLQLLERPMALAAHASRSFR